MRLLLTALGFAVTCICIQLSWAAVTPQPQLDPKLLDLSKEFDTCILDALYHFLYPQTLPPTDQKGLTESCAKQSAAFRCLKEKIKTGNHTALMKRGIKGFLTQRQKVHKKFCTNVNSDQSKEFLRDMKCLMDKKLAKFSEIESIQANTGLEIVRRNYNDSAIELKYACCSLAQTKKSMLDITGPDCESAKPNLEFILQDDVSLLCEDDDKLLTQVCPKLEPIKVGKNYEIKKNPSTIGVFLYLFLTIGEPAKF